MAFAALAAEAVAQGSVAADRAALVALLDGVAEIGAPDVPGPLCVYGPQTFPVVVGATKDARAAAVAAGRWQAATAAALGHSGYFRRATLETADTGRLLANALEWAAGQGAPPEPRIGVVGADELRAWLTKSGCDAVEAALTPESLRAVDVVALIVGDQSVPEIFRAPARRFSRSR